MIFCFLFVCFILASVKSQSIVNSNFESNPVGSYTYMVPSGWSGTSTVVIAYSSGAWGGGKLIPVYIKIFALKNKDAHKYFSISFSNPNY